MNHTEIVFFDHLARFTINSHHHNLRRVYQSMILEWLSTSVISLHHKPLL